MKKHILVIEDDPDLLGVITWVLTDKGYRATGINGLTSVEELLAYKADCFVIDENLPGTTGHIICILLKSKIETRNVPVILMSASHQLRYHASLCEADAYLPKPFNDINEVTETIHRLLKN